MRTAMLRKKPILYMAELNIERTWVLEILVSQLLIPPHL